MVEARRRCADTSTPDPNADPNSDKTNTTNDNTNADDPNKKPGFWEKNKKWLAPTAWVAGGLTLLAAGYKLLSGKKEKPTAKEKPLEGLKSRKKSPQKKNVKKKSIELL